MDGDNLLRGWILEMQHGMADALEGFYSSEKSTDSGIKSLEEMIRC